MNSIIQAQGIHHITLNGADKKTSIDFYATVRSLYLQDRERKIKNLKVKTDTLDDSDWDSLEDK